MRGKAYFVMPVICLVILVSTGNLQAERGLGGVVKKEAKQLETLIGSSPDGVENRWAVLIGIDHYQSPEISSLQGAVQDVLAIRNALVKYARFPSDNVITLTSDNLANLPKLVNIITKLEYMEEKVKPGDAFLFYFSGHGIRSGGKNYLLTYESEIRNQFILERFSLPVIKLRKRLEQIRAGKVILVLDACRNNPRTGKGDKDNMLTGEFARGLMGVEPGFGKKSDIKFSAALFACKVGERAFEWPGQRRGFFSVALEEGLQGFADSPKGDYQITLNEIESYLHHRVPDLIKREIGGGRKQTPWVDRSGAGAGDWVISWKSIHAGKKKTPKMKPTPYKKFIPHKEVEKLVPELIGGNPPTIKITSAPQKGLLIPEAKKITIRFQADDDRGVSGYRYQLNDKPVRETLRSYARLNDVKTGYHTFQVQVKDAEGNWSEPAVKKFTVLPNQRPEADIITPEKEAFIESGKFISVKVSASDRDGQVMKYRFAIDNPDDFQEKNSPETRFDAEKLADGPHTIYAQVIDDKKEVSNWTSRKFTFKYMENWREPTTGMEFVWIPAGSFMMGSNNGDSDEKPVHKVTLTKGFYMQTTEVTQGQWKKIMGDNPSHFENCGDDCPVEKVSWNDVQKFFERLNQQSPDGDYKFSLPTEAQWEYAARAGSTTRYYFGNSDNQLGDYAWYNSNSDRKTHPAARKKPNAWGLYDMHGNVWEWCADRYGNYSVADSVVDPVGPFSGDRRVLRGGSWLNDGRYCRSARRGHTPGPRSRDYGFRLSRGQEE